MLLLVLRHPTCASCVAWMCCRMSNSIKHVWACPDLSSRRGHRFLIAIMLLMVLRHPTCASCVAWMCCWMSNSIEHVWQVPIYHRGVGIDFPLQSCCSWCYVIQPVHHVLHECVVGCPLLSSMYKRVPIFHFIVFDSTPSYILCALTFHHRVRCSSGLKQLAKHHWHVTNTSCKAPKKP